MDNEAVGGVVVDDGGDVGLALGDVDVDPAVGVASGVGPAPTSGSLHPVTTSASARPARVSTRPVRMGAG